jgi:hypothetical protein
MAVGSAAPPQAPAFPPYPDATVAVDSADNNGTVLYTCLKRHVAREIYRLLRREATPPIQLLAA